jgi:hypothetical protein
VRPCYRCEGCQSLKGLGLECVKVVWFDRPWLGESPADIHNFYKCPFNLILNYSCLAI